MEKPPIINVQRSQFLLYFHLKKKYTKIGTQSIPEQNSKFELSLGAIQYT